MNKPKIAATGPASVELKAGQKIYGVLVTGLAFTHNSEMLDCKTCHQYSFLQ